MDIRLVARGAGVVLWKIANAFRYIKINSAKYGIRYSFHVPNRDGKRVRGHQPGNEIWQSQYMRLVKWRAVMCKACEKIQAQRQLHAMHA
jgi:hypothetical protein